MQAKSTANNQPANVREPKQLKPLMRVFCAWCKRELPPVEVETPTDLVSHGACPACAARQLEELRQTVAAEEARRNRNQRIPA